MASSPTVTRVVGGNGSSAVNGGVGSNMVGVLKRLLWNIRLHSKAPSGNCRKGLRGSSMRARGLRTGEGDCLISHLESAK